MVRDGGAPWVVARVHPQYGHRARVNVENQGAEYYRPMAMLRSDRTRLLRPGPLFPGYAFIRHPEGLWAFLRGTIGILDVILSASERPGLVPAGEIARLRAREGPDGMIRLESREFQVGERVRVEKGAVSLDAIVDGMSGRDRVFVLLKLLGDNWQRAEVDVKDILR